MCAAQDERAVGEIINFGHGDTTSVAELARQILQIVGRDIRVNAVVVRYRPQMSEVSRLQADRSKAERLLAWVPEVPLTEGLKRTVRWISDHMEECDPNICYT